MDVPYGITRRLPNDNLDAARARITASLQVEGFGVLTEIDVQSSASIAWGASATSWSTKAIA